MYNPQRVRLRTVDGRTLDFDGARGVVRFADANGNNVSILPTGIVHSNGKSIAFTRDAADRITMITDPLGRQLQYAYDTAGDLVALVDQLGNRTTFDYDAHRLTAIHDPLGNAFHTVLTAEIPGRKVMILGCGPIGLMAIAIARACGAAAVGRCVRLDGCERDEVGVRRSRLAFRPRLLVVKLRRCPLLFHFPASILCASGRLHVVAS